MSGIRLGDSFYFKSYCHAPWGFENPPLQGALFHFVIQGSAQIETEAGSYLTIATGDLALFPHGTGHIARSGPGAPIETLDSARIEPAGENASIMTLGSGDETSVIICGGLSFDPPWHPLIAALPTLLLHRTKPTGTAHDTLIALMGEEVSQDLPGSEAVITRLSEVLVITALRDWMMHGDASGWIFALRDPGIGHTLVRLHQSPETPWTVARLAKEADVSRTVYAERFHKMVGTPPMKYLLNLRMHLAADKIRQNADSLEAISTSVGYDSMPSFSRAFKRHWGQPPGAFRAEG